MREIKKLFSLMMVFCMICSMTIFAQARASDYFAATDVWVTRTSGGNFLVEFDICATHIMNEIGATEIYIYEQQSDGDYENIYTYTSEKMSALVTYNESAHGYSLTYHGTSGKRYFATLALYCRDDNGAEWLMEDTNIITA